MNDSIDEIVEINSIKMRSLNDMVVRAARDGKFEPETFECWKEWVTPGSVVVDIGAYTGIYSIYASLAGATAYAFEPNQNVYNRLEENCELNNVRVLCYNVAISDTSGVRNFHTKNMKLTSAGALSAEGDTQVTTCCLDSYLYKTPRVNAIKIDVEGHEANVLRGARTCIQRNKPLVIAEANFYEDEQEIIHIMHNYGYSMPTFVDERNMLFKP